jgi:hypothetical protein
VRVDQKIVEKARYYLHLNSIQVTFLTHLRSSSTLKEIVWFHLKPVLKKLKSRINVQDKKDPVIEHIGIIYFKLKNVQKIMKEKEFQYLITTPDFYSEIFIIVKDFVELSRLVISMARKLLVTKSQKSDSQKRIHYHNRASSYARKFCKKWKYLKEGGHVTIDLDIIVKDFLLHYVLDEKAKLQEIKKQLKEMTVYIPFDGTCDELFKNLTYYKVEIWVTMLLEKIVRNMVKGEKKKKLITDYIDSIEYEVLNLLFENPEGLSKNEIAKILASQTNKSARACQNWLSKVLPQLEEKGLIRNGKHENWRLNF